MSCDSSTRTGARRTTCLSARSTWLDNPLLREPLRIEDVKPRLLGHWGTTPGLGFLYAHMNRVIKRRDVEAIFVTGPGHGGPGLVANTYLEGSYSDVYHHIGRDGGWTAPSVPAVLVPGGVPSHGRPRRRARSTRAVSWDTRSCTPTVPCWTTPTSWRCASSATARRRPPLAASWHSNKFLNPASDGAVLPVLHLNGYKIANPTVLARIPHDELRALFEGYGYAPRFVEGSAPDQMHQLWRARSTRCSTTSARSTRPHAAAARASGRAGR
jgi:xylulose-5-phosphate/fructose-6-phosphate phosphoketolase